MAWGKEWNAWGKEWNDGVPPIWPVPKEGESISVSAINQIWQNAQANAKIEYDLTAGIIVTKTTIENGEIKIKDVTKEYNNLKPTHDPYTNPDAHIYYECKCGDILDPGTKSFASLNNHASDKGWKVRFGSDGYTPYCVKCGEGVE